jgi:hypothetical protein
MEGYILNNSGATIHIFKTKFLAGDKIRLEKIWPLYETRARKDLGKKNVSEEEFVAWLEANHYMQPGFVYNSAKEQTVPVDILVSTSPEIAEEGASADGRLVRPPLADATTAVIDKLTWRDIADLRVVDDPKKIINGINNRSKLRRAYTACRGKARKQHLENILRARIQELERIGA